MSKLNIPILFLIFNRPESTKKVFARIREAKPKQLFVAADGPREDRPTDKEKCMQTRQIINEVDWECEVKTLFREKNMGCGIAVSQAIDWFFEQEEQGIILEDDCLPLPSFFSFCEDLLAYYADAEEIFHISGNNFTGKKSCVDESYYFSKYSFLWGWATWRRAWKNFDYQMSDWPYIRDNDLFASLFANEQEKNYWYRTFDKLYNNVGPSSWGFRWLYTLWKNKALAVLPKYNLVENIGFDNGATHTKQNPIRTKIISKNFQISDHPSNQSINIKLDLIAANHIFFRKKSIRKRVRKFIEKKLKVLQKV